MMERSLDLPWPEGGTRCRVNVVMAPAGPAAIVTEDPDNPGVSVEFAFPVVAEYIRSLLPHDAAEPLWVRRWPGHALAESVFRERRGFDTHLMTYTEQGWISRPLPQAVARHLLDLLGRCGEDLAPHRPARSGRQGHDDRDADLGKGLPPGEGLRDTQNLVPLRLLGAGRGGTQGD
jgi:hypothetical protein